MKTYKFIISLLGTILFVVGLWLTLNLGLGLIGLFTSAIGFIMIVTGVIDKREVVEENEVIHD